MHIDPKSSANILPPSTVTVSRSTGHSRREHGSSDDSSDGVQLSHLSSVLNGLAAGASAGSKRISSLAALYQSGSYQVNPAQVSQRMIDDALIPD